MKRSFFLVFHIVYLLTIGGNIFVFADDIPVVFDIKDNIIRPGKKVVLTLTFPESGDIAETDIPFTPGVDIKLEEKNKIGESKTAYIYSLVALKEGVFDIGPFVLKGQKNRYVSNVIKLNVTKDLPSDRFADIYTDIDYKKEIKERIFLELNVMEDVIYQNQKVNVRLSLYSDWIDLEDINLWEASSENLILSSFKDRTVDIVEREGKSYALLSYFASLYALTPGEFQLDPVRVSFRIARARKDKGNGNRLLNDNEDFYNSFIGVGDSKSFEIESDPLLLHVKTFPDRGKPASFLGSVGDFDYKVELDKNEILPGETVTITSEIKGEGNYDTLIIPEVVSDDFLTAYEPDIQKNNDSVMVIQHIRIDSRMSVQIPVLTFSFFSPKLEKYKSIVQGPFPIFIKGSTANKNEDNNRAQSAPDVEAESVIPIKKNTGKLIFANAVPQISYLAVILFILALPIAMIVISKIIGDEKRRRALDPKYAALVRAKSRFAHNMRTAENHLKQGSTAKFYERLFIALQEYMGERLMRAPSGVSGSICKELSGKDIKQAVLSEIECVFNECHAARYSNRPYEKKDHFLFIKRIKNLISVLNKVKEL